MFCQRNRWLDVGLSSQVYKTNSYILIIFILFMRITSVNTTIIYVTQVRNKPLWHAFFYSNPVVCCVKKWACIYCTSGFSDQQTKSAIVQTWSINLFKKPANNIITLRVIHSGTDQKDITNKRNLLCGQINNVLCYFGKRDPVTKLLLMRSYCSSLYESVLWNLTNLCVENVCVVWRKGLRRVWNVPHHIHTYIHRVALSHWETNCPGVL